MIPNLSYYARVRSWGSIGAKIGALPALGNNIPAAPQSHFCNLHLTVYSHQTKAIRYNIICSTTPPYYFYPHLCVHTPRHSIFRKMGQTQAPSTTKAVVVRKSNGKSNSGYVNNATLETLPLPQLKSGEILVKMHAVAFNHRDVRTGTIQRVHG